MASPLPTWSLRAADGIRRLAERPWTLFFVLLACNAIARPCSATAHDARLYSLQALNQAEAGAYADDIFLRFGSQDRFSLFSRVVGPLVATFGVRVTFFALYLIFNALFIAALFRLVRALIADSLVATLALIYLVTAPLNYGSGDVFTVHEPFFTPRLVGTTFTLFALERLLAGRWLTAFALLVPGLLFHPLMAFGGVLIAVGFVAAGWLSPRVFAGVVAAAGIAFIALLTAGPLAVRLFGAMDGDWHHLIRIAVGYNYADTWSAKAWLNVAVSFALPLLASVALFRDDPVRRRFVLIAALAGAAGLVVHIAASYLPFALLFQGQAYRVLWILKVLQVPLGFLLISQWSHQYEAQAAGLPGKVASLALVAFFCVVHGIVLELTIIATAVAGSLSLARIVANDGDRAWWWHGAARGLVLGAIAWMAYRCWFFAMQRALIAQHFDLNEWVLFDLVSPWVMIAGVVVCNLFSEHAAQASDKALACVACSIAVMAPIALVATEACPDFRRQHGRLGVEMAQLGEFVQSHHGSAARPCVYCPFNRPDLLWIDAKVTSYFSIIQTAGVMFNRQTAIEIDRRASVVAKFELAQQRDEAIFLDDAKKLGMANLFKLDFNSPAPGVDDLVRLCAEPGLDFVVIPQEFPGLYSAKVGRLFVYECYKVKTPITRNSP